MEDPEREITPLIHLLTQSPPSLQETTIIRYFTPTASFTHPFCRTGSFNGSRWLIWRIYRWYKIMSPRIDLNVNSVAYDKQNLKLYVSLHQTFRIWLLPGHASHVNLTTVLDLIESPSLSGTNESKKPKFLIQSQNDLYQVDEFVKFPATFGLLRLLLLLVQVFATLLCVLGSWVFWFVSWGEENVVGGNWERSLLRDHDED